MFRRRFWWSLLLTIPVVASSQTVMDGFGYELDFPGVWLVGPVMLLIAMAITVAYVATLLMLGPIVADASLFLVSSLFAVAGMATTAVLLPSLVRIRFPDRVHERVAWLLVGHTASPD
jgi:cyanate permease